MRSDIQEIESCFTEIPLLGYWAAIKQTYENMGFNDPMTDTQIIEEYSYISEQMHKFISKKRSEIMQYDDNLERMLDVVNDIISKVDETSKDRKTLIYYMLRDDWLAQLRNIIWYTMDNLTEEDDG